MGLDQFASPPWLRPSVQGMVTRLRREMMSGLLEMGGNFPLSKVRLWQVMDEVGSYYGRPRGNLSAYYAPLPRRRRKASLSWLLKESRSFERDRRRYTKRVLQNEEWTRQHWERVIFDQKHNSFHFPRAFFVTGSCRLFLLLLSL